MKALLPEKFISIVGKNIDTAGCIQMDVEEDAFVCILFL